MREEMNLADFWNIIIINKKLIIRITITLMIVALIGSLIMPKSYISESAIKQPVPEVYSAAETKSLIKSGAILSQVLTNLYPTKTIQEFNEKNLEVEIYKEELSRNDVEELPFLKIKVTAESSQKAQEINYAIIDSLFNYSKEDYENNLKFIEDSISQVTKRIEETNKDIKNLETQINSAPSNQLNGDGISKTILLRGILSDEKMNLGLLEKEKLQLEQELRSATYYEITTEPNLPNKPETPNIPLNLAISLIFGIILSLGFIIFKDAIKRD